MNISKVWTREERQILEDYIKRSFPSRHIAELLQRHKNTVDREIRRFVGYRGSRFDYSAHEAHIAYLKRHEARYDAVRKALEGRTVGVNNIYAKLDELYKQIESIKQQIDIIFDIIKETNGKDN
jgi:IS30 family transposase